MIKNLLLLGYCVVDAFQLIINDIIYNEQTHIVSAFKDYLIFDDISEFLKRFYTKSEAI